ncbi:MAG: SDR family NAD(P)-dependent oxidoreductase [Myxococcales bacterium]|nr:SDR family NAD(P)-dependent oxidoreductase [Myxococcales bacterium]
MTFSDKVVVITGAGSGIGRGLAAGFCRDGAQVVGMGRTAESLEKTAAEHGQERMHTVVGDVAKQADVDRLFAEAIERHGRVDILINNAAIYPRVRFLDVDVDEWAKVLEVNVLGMARCCRAALPGMLERRSGRIVNLGSFAWKGPIDRASGYSVSKAAVHALTKAIAAEIDSSTYPDVLVNELLPGIVRTSMSETGDDPMDVYAHAKAVASLPAGGPTGKVFLRGQLHDEHGGGGGVKRKLSRLLGR